MKGVKGDLRRVGSVYRWALMDYGQTVRQGRCASREEATQQLKAARLEHEAKLIERHNQEPKDKLDFNPALQALRRTRRNGNKNYRYTAKSS